MISSSQLLLTGKTDFPAIQVQHLNHYFGEGEVRKQALFDNNLTIQPGEIVIMTGPSGSGKTTLLVLAGTLRSVQAGSLKTLGQELKGATPHQLMKLRREIGFIFQAHNLFDSLTAYENVKMSLQLFHVEEKEARKRSYELLERLDLGHRIDYKPGNLSGGQKQRVAIARGLVHRPKLVLADEPTAALDKESGRIVVNLFKELAQNEGVTVLMVTHDNRVLDVADRIVQMVDGRITSDGHVTETTFLVEFLKKSSVFAGMRYSQLTEMASEMVKERHPVHSTIIRKGDPGDKFYIIHEGEVNVIDRDETGEHPLATLGKGDFFGEAALLTGEPRNADVIAKTDVEIFALGAKEFGEALTRSPSFEDEVRRALFLRR
jgi:putative ABC transport system ATP-binding protein